MKFLWTTLSGFRFHGLELQSEIVTLAKPAVAGRNADTVAHHIEKFQALGVSPPSRTPVLYLGSLWRVIVGTRAGSLAQMLLPASPRRLYSNDDALPEDTVMSCGTLAAIGGIRPAERFECEVIDPVLQRRMHCSYDINVLPIVC